MQNNKSSKMENKKLLTPPAQEQQVSDEVLTPAPEETNQGKATTSEETKDRKCRICGCTDDNCSMCIKLTGEPCHWVEDNLCSACIDAVKFNNGERSDLIQAPEVVEPSVPQVFEPVNFFQQLFPLLDGVHLTIRAKRISGALVVEVLPNTAVTMKSVELKGSAEEIDEAFFQHVTGPITAAQGLVVEEKQAPLDPEKKNNPSTRRSSVKRKPVKKSAKPVVKKEAKPKAEPKPKKEKVVKPKPVKPAAPDLFAGV